MGFSDIQIRRLSRRVPARHVKSRIHEGKEFSYIEGWYALDQANRIFGFDRWDRETIETRCIHAHQDRSSAALAIYCARVRVTVRTEDGLVIRDGHGTGEARANSLGEAHDRALKAAETDATKRALATFGRAFGLALYAGSKAAAPPRYDTREDQANPVAGATVLSQRAQSSDIAAAQTRLVMQACQTGAADSAINSTSEGKQSPVISEKPNLGEPATSGSNATRAALLPGKDIRRGTPLQRLTIDKSTLTFSEPKRVRDKEHLRFVASRPCVLCGHAPSDAHHVGYAQPRAMARKVSDEFTVPLCRTHHGELHQEGNESAWWHDMGIDPLTIARQMWMESQAHTSRPSDKTKHSNRTD